MYDKNWLELYWVRGTIESNKKGVHAYEMLEKI